MNAKWNSYQIRGWGGFILEEKLKMLKQDLKIWRVETFGNLEDFIEKKTSELERLDILDNNFGLYPSEIETRATLMSNILLE